jgi:uncharacterized membrane protein SirB2
LRAGVPDPESKGHSLMSISDALFAFTEWLRTTPVVDLSLWISETKASLWIGNHFWAIPIMQNIHILSIAASFSAVLMISMRILGLSGGGRTMSHTVRRYMPWIWWSLLLLIVSGIGMIIGEPVRELVNPIFWIKMGLVILVILVSAGFHSSVSRNVARWEASHEGRVAVRIGTVAVIILWCAVMFGGRWIAYAPV